MYKKYKKEKLSKSNRFHINLKPFLEGDNKNLVIFLSLSIFILIILSYMFSGDEIIISPQCVGVVKVEGTITTQSQPPSLFSEGSPSSDQIAKTIEKASKKDNVKALLIEINSPGGGVVASREIYEALKEVKKPTVAYIREIGASGGYYVAVASDEIIASPEAITGSIGVITTFTNLKGLFEKVGINYTVIKSGKYKDIGGFYRDMNESERGIIQQIVNEIYQEFYDVVKENRGDRLKDFDSIADGRILTGRQALKYGLVDDVGNFRKALKRAAALANMTYEEEPETCYFSTVSETYPFAGLFSGFKIDLNIGDNFLVQAK